jgi:hypothetical protein
MSYYTTNSLTNVRLKMVERYLKKGKSSYEVVETLGV